ncbi:type I toxin-antitoxin system SymE family toxin [Chitinophaga pendula]|uniref:SymE family type I addiction module toxin n=1 Tax=Chitinophaga TaxID=79328 RepID=UPI000BB00E66|nr:MULTISPECIES: SymE family type I addiction module toxin [Chitinophaga]ASZ13544.1 hypothetical protein CK934_22615 [Chitinophaga sp. MD30]UCJ08823.1 type I toxin-antitoxin system SymE family toxin [Chitinophaga pendula]
MAKTIRFLKLQAKYIPNRKEPHKLDEIPCLNMSGRWLAAAGFKAGDQIEVKIGKRGLSIRRKKAGNISA